MIVKSEEKLTDAIIQEAKRHPGGWVYKIEGEYGPSDSVPPESVVGAWKVDESGEIEGDFIPNPNYKPKEIDD
jgi:hypothetical protein